MAITRWNAERMPVFSDLINNFFGSDISDFLSENKGTVPSVNVIETDENYKVEVAAPGMEKDNFEIKLENGLLTINGKKEEHKEDKKENYLRKEHSYSSFNRSFHLPEVVEVDQINANYKDGMLCVTLPKKEEVKKLSTPRTIQIT